MKQQVAEPIVSPTLTTTEPPKPRKHRTAKILGLVATIVLLCAVTGYIGSQLHRTNPNVSSAAARLTPAVDGNKTVTQAEQTIASVAEKVSPSVVSIVTTSNTRSYYGVSEQQGAGSGIIVSSNGYVLTNKHVVSGTNTVSIVLADGTTHDNVQVLGTDPLNDVAFLKIPGVSNLPAAELGDSNTVRVGQSVVAIGNSLGQYQNTVTSGIISGTGRPVSASAGDDSVENLTDLLQTDAAINPGNSGGPLLNLAGQVIGINTAIAEDAQSIGFSLPINATKGILKGVLKDNKVARAYLGVNFVPITADIASRYSLPVKKGGYVFAGDGKSAVQSGSPADKAGIQDKDIITKVGSETVGDTASVSSMIAEYAPGDTVTLTILRDGKTLTVNVALGTYSS